MAYPSLPDRRGISDELHEPRTPRRCGIILESVTEGVFTVDKDWRITYFNRAAERIIGTTRSEALGRHCWDVFRANICQTGCALRQTMDSGQPVVNRAVMVVKRTGEKIPIRISTAVLRNPDGRFAGAVETFRDLSQVEELRRELEGRFRLGDIIGRSPAMRDLFGLLPSVAASDSTVVIHGASGTGKELFANAIHQLSPRREKTFRRHQLRRPARHAPRVRALRLQGRRLHGRTSRQGRQIRPRRRRHDLPGRDRRHFPGDADPPAARAPGAHLPAPRRSRAGERRRAGRGRYPP